MWLSSLQPELEAPINDNKAEPYSELWDSDRYTDLIAPKPQGTLAEDNNSTHDINTLIYKGKNIPVVTGTQPVGHVMACLDMLARYYNVPFRRDVVERSARHVVGNNLVTLEQLGNLATILGFTGSLADIPSTQFSRLPFPCFAIILKQPAMIHDIHHGRIKAVLPEYGRVELNLDDLTGDQSMILMLSPGRDTQQRKLGLSWFYPQIRKYRRSLIEVFVASLINCLILLNPW